MTVFTVGITRDFLNPEGKPGDGDLDIGLGLLDAAGLRHEFLAEATPELRADQVADYDAVLVLGPRISRRTLEGADRLTLVARFGVGYDSVDVGACTEHGIAVTITPDGVRRPVSMAAITLLLALAHRLPAKDRLVREGRWGDRVAHMGIGVTGRTLGVVGFGNIGQDLCRLAVGLGLRVLASDPFGSPEAAARLGVPLVGLEALLRQSDFVSVCCALTHETRHLLDAERLAMMKPTAFLINVARGPVVDGVALAEALHRGRLQGAGLDVFEQEPPDPQDPLLHLDNVILSPHALCWTDQCFSGNGRQACQAIVDVARGAVPGPLVDPMVVDSERFRSRLEHYAQKAGIR